jgi:hypothetical protein
MFKGALQVSQALRHLPRDEFKFMQAVSKKTQLASFNVGDEVFLLCQ